MRESRLYQVFPVKDNKFELAVQAKLRKNKIKFIKKLQENKLLTIRAGENVIRILPPLNVKKAEIDLSIKIIKKVCKEYKN